MNVQAYEEAAQLMESRLDLMHFRGGCPDAVIEKAEIILDVKFLGSYRRFLQDYGAGVFGGSEIYGVIVDEEGKIAKKGLTNVVVKTLAARSDYGLPLYLVLISELGNGAVYCLDSRKNPFPIVVYWYTYSKEVQTYEVETNDFGEFFLAQVKLALEVFR